MFIMILNNDIKFSIVKLFIHKLCRNIIRSKIANMLPEALGAQSLEVSVKYPVLRIQKTKTVTIYSVFA